MSAPSRIASVAGRTVIVTGGAGFIGSNLVDALVEAGARVRVIDNLATGRRENLNSSADVIDADIRDAAAIAPAFAGIDCVFHVAALPRIPLSIAKPLETHLTNVVGTLNVLMAAREARVRRVIFSGSSSVYGNAPIPMVETMTPDPQSPYALQKLEAENYLRMFHRLYGMQTLTLRYFAVYGPRMAYEGAYMLAIAAFLRARREGRAMEIFGDGEQTRDFTHVRDVVRANILAAGCEVADGRAINIGRGRNVSIKAIAAIVGGPVVYREPRAADMRHTLADNSQARRVLGWMPEIDVEAGIAELLRA